MDLWYDGTWWPSAFVPTERKMVWILVYTLIYLGHHGQTTVHPSFRRLTVNASSSSLSPYSLTHIHPPRHSFGNPYHTTIFTWTRSPERRASTRVLVSGLVIKFSVLIFILLFIEKEVIYTSQFRLY